MPCNGGSPRPVPHGADGPGAAGQAGPGHWGTTGLQGGRWPRSGSRGVRAERRSPGASWEHRDSEAGLRCAAAPGGRLPGSGQHATSQAAGDDAHPPTERRKTRPPHGPTSLRLAPPQHAGGSGPRAPTVPGPWAQPQQGWLRPGPTRAKHTAHVHAAGRRGVATRVRACVLHRGPCAARLAPRAPCPALSPARLPPLLHKKFCGRQNPGLRFIFSVYHLDGLFHFWYNFLTTIKNDLIIKNK